ncbi:hypothetical protein ACR82Z_03035 [Mycoplasma sp. 6243]|uniref:hypothetical protein n=1 Tax=Mycoplasma sp. 6243 TaxID=3440865 RepID=UPI003EBC824E
MEKQIFFIDFEAVTVNYLNIHKSKLKDSVNYHKDLPYCYSIGTFKGGSYKNRFGIIRFKNITYEKALIQLREKITKDIQTLIGDKEFIPVASNCVFYGWGAGPENWIMEKLFKISVKKFSTIQVKLDNVVPDSIFSTSKYFENIKNIAKTIKHPVLSMIKQNTEDGRIACWYGLAMLLDGRNIYHIDAKVKNQMHNDLRIYNLDDCKKLAFLYKNKFTAHKLIGKIFDIRREIQSLNAQILTYDKYIEYLKSLTNEKNPPLLIKHDDIHKIKGSQEIPIEILPSLRLSKKIWNDRVMRDLFLEQMIFIVNKRKEEIQTKKQELNEKILLQRNNWY